MWRGCGLRLLIDGGEEGGVPDASDGDEDITFRSEGEEGTRARQARPALSSGGV